MDGLPVISPYINLTGWLAVIVLVIISMVRGWLIAGSQVQRLIDAYKTIIEDKNKQITNLENAVQRQDARGDILAQNQRDLLDSVKATNTLVQSALFGRDPTNVVNHVTSDTRESAV